MPNITRYDETRSRVYCAAAGIKGSFGDDWNYKIDATAMHTDLRRTSSGYIYIQHLLDVIADGTYNFVNPSANSAAIQNYLAPTLNTDASSDLYQVQGEREQSAVPASGRPGPARGGRLALLRSGRSRPRRTATSTGRPSATSRSTRSAPTGTARSPRRSAS